MNSKFVSNGQITDVVKPGSLLHLIYCGLSPQSEFEYNRLKQFNSYVTTPNGVISYDGVHVFSKCSNADCEICQKYKNKST